MPKKKARAAKTVANSDGVDERGFAEVDHGYLYTGPVGWLIEAAMKVRAGALSAYRATIRSEIMKARVNARSDATLLRVLELLKESASVDMFARSGQFRQIIVHHHPIVATNMLVRFVGEHPDVLRQTATMVASNSGGQMVEFGWTKKKRPFNVTVRAWALRREMWNRAIGPLRQFEDTGLVISGVKDQDVFRIVWEEVVNSGLSTGAAPLLAKFFANAVAQELYGAALAETR